MTVINKNHIQRLPQRPIGIMVGREKEQVDNNAIYALIQTFQNDLTAKFDKLSLDVGNLRLLVVEDKAYARAQDLPARVEAQEKRIDTLENLVIARDAQIKLLKWFAGFASFIGTILALWLAVKEIWGK